MKIRFRKRLSPALKTFLAVTIFFGVAGTALFTYYYVHFSRLIEKRLSGQIFANTSRLYAAPEPVFLEQEETISNLTASLRRAGYSENKTNRVGWYQAVSGGIEIFPGPDSYFQDEPALLRLGKGRVTRI